MSRSALWIAAAADSAQLFAPGALSVVKRGELRLPALNQSFLTRKKRLSPRG